MPTQARSPNMKPAPLQLLVSAGLQAAQCCTKNSQQLMYPRLRLPTERVAICLTNPPEAPTPALETPTFSHRLAVVAIGYSNAR